MNKNIKIIKGKVKKNLSNTMFLVELNKKEIVCYISGKIRINYIRIMPGDIVKVEVDKKIQNKGRIVYRVK